MVISGLIRSSLIDYPGRLSAVIFTQGCNFRCGFCHNPDLIANSDQRTAIGRELSATGLDPVFAGSNPDKGVVSEKEVLDFLETRKGKLDGVVITGGEPTVQKDLIGFIKKIKDLGYLIKLDTNGSNSQVLSNLLNYKLIDYVAMDIKNSPDKYQETCAYPFSKQIRGSIKLMMSPGIDYEFRTTVLPLHHKPEDFNEIGKIIKGAKKYTLQGFRDENLLDENLKGTKKFTREELKEIKSVLEKYVKEVDIRENL